MPLYPILHRSKHFNLKSFIVIYLLWHHCLINMSQMRALNLVTSTRIKLLLTTLNLLWLSFPLVYFDWVSLEKFLIATTTHIVRFIFIALLIEPSPWLLLLLQNFTLVRFYACLPSVVTGLLLILIYIVDLI